MSMPALFKGRLSIPVIGSPLFIISVPDLVIAQCKAGVVGSFPALNARPAGRLCSIGTGQLQARRAVPWATEVLRDHLLNVKNHSFVSFWGSHAGLRLTHQRQSESL